MLRIPSWRNPSWGNGSQLRSGDVTDFYSVLCVSGASEPVGRRSTAWALLWKWFSAFWGEKVAKWIFITFLHFSNVIFMHIFPFSLRDVFVWNQEGKNKFERQKNHNRVV